MKSGLPNFQLSVAARAAGSAGFLSGDIDEAPAAVRHRQGRPLRFPAPALGSRLAASGSPAPACRLGRQCFPRLGPAGGAVSGRSRPGCPRAAPPGLGRADTGGAPPPARALQGVCSSSPGSTGTSARPMASPSSTPSLTQCTVQPWLVWPASSAREWVCRPGKAGSRLGVDVDHPPGPCAHEARASARACSRRAQPVRRPRRAVVRPSPPRARADPS